jgi:hypothetical protein
MKKLTVSAMLAAIVAILALQSGPSLAQGASGLIFTPSDAYYGEVLAQPFAAAPAKTMRSGSAGQRHN